MTTDNNGVISLYPVTINVPDDVTKSSRIVVWCSIISNDITTEGYFTVRTHTNNLICVRTWGYYASANAEVYILPVTSE